MMPWGPIDVMDRLTGGRFSGARYRRGRAASRGPGYGAGPAGRRTGSLLDAVNAVVVGFFTGISMLAGRHWFRIISGVVGFMVLLNLILGGGGSALTVAGLYVLFVGIFGARVNARKAAHEARIRYVIAGVVHGRIQENTGNVEVVWQGDEVAEILFSFPATKSGEATRLSMERRLNEMLPEYNGVANDWRFRWNMRDQTVVAHPVAAE